MRLCEGPGWTGSENREDEESSIPTLHSTGQTGMDGGGACKQSAEEANASALAKTPSDNSSAVCKLLLVFPPGIRPLAQFSRCRGHAQNLISAFPFPPARLNTADLPTTPQKPSEDSHKALNEKIKSPEFKHKFPEESSNPGMCPGETIPTCSRDGHILAGAAGGRR